MMALNLCAMCGEPTPSQMRRNDRLVQWLEHMNARLLWEQRIKGVGMIACYMANGRVFIVQVFDDTLGRSEHGWEIYMPPSTGNNIDETLAEAERRLCQ